MVEQLAGRYFRSFVLAIGVALVALALPVQASAAQPSIFLSTLAAKAGVVRASLFANMASGEQPTTVDATLSKGAAAGGRAGSPTVGEFDSYAFSKGVTYTAKSNLSSAQLKGTFRMKRGSIKMTFHATKGATKIPLGKGCTGTPGKQRKGLLKGSFKLKADRLGTLKLSSLKATLMIPPSESCPTPPPPKFHGESVSGFSGGKTHSVSVAATKTKGAVSESVTTSSGGSGWSFFHSVFISGLPTSDYTFSPNLTKAKVTGHSPLKGTASYKGNAVTSNFSSGKLTGNLKATFATIGSVKLFAHGALTGSQSRS